jgi:hypothetical protein
MPDITINSVIPTSTDEKLTFVFSAPPNADWQKEFMAGWQKNQTLANSGLNKAISNNTLILTGNCGNPQALLDELKKVIAEVNQQQSGFQQKLKDLKF